MSDMGALQLLSLGGFSGGVGPDATGSCGVSVAQSGRKAESGKVRGVSAGPEGHIQFD